MKKRFLLTVLVLIAAIATLFSCSPTNEHDPWEDAIYTEDTSFGNGATTVYVTVEVGENKVVFTLNTDKTILGEALMEHSLIDGEESAYGLYLKVVNGITADYDIDASYWAFYKDSDYMLVGVDSAEISDGESYSLVYTK